MFSKGSSKSLLQCIYMYTITSERITGVEKIRLSNTRVTHHVIVIFYIVHYYIKCESYYDFHETLYTHFILYYYYCYYCFNNRPRRIYYSVLISLRLLEKYSVRGMAGRRDTFTLCTYYRRTLCTYMYRYYAAHTPKQFNAIIILFYYVAYIYLVCINSTRICICAHHNIIRFYDFELIITDDRNSGNEHSQNIVLYRTNLYRIIWYTLCWVLLLPLLLLPLTYSSIALYNNCLQKSYPRKKSTDYHDILCTVVVAHVTIRYDNT